MYAYMHAYADFHLLSSSVSFSNDEAGGLKSSVQLEMIYYTWKMEKTYRCPKCNGAEITWDRGIRKAVCPKDRTPVDNYEAVGIERAKQTKSHK